MSDTKNAKWLMTWQGPFTCELLPDDGLRLADDDSAFELIIPADVRFIDNRTQPDSLPIPTITSGTHTPAGVALTWE